MSSFALDYPSGGSYSTSWTPSKDPDIDSSKIEDDMGLLGDLMADGATSYVYRIVPSYSRYTFSFSGLTATDRSNFATFLAAVGGEAFDLTNGTCGPITTETKVKFSSDGVRPQWQLSGGETFSVVLAFIDSA